MVRSKAEIRSIAKKVVILVEQTYPVKAAYLFGSYAKDNPDENSDIDIALFCDKVDNISIDELMNFIADIQTEIGAEVELHIFPSSKIKEMRPTNFYGYIRSHGKKIAA